MHVAYMYNAHILSTCHGCLWRLTIIKAIGVPFVSQNSHMGPKAGDQMTSL